MTAWWCDGCGQHTSGIAQVAWALRSGVVLKFHSYDCYVRARSSQQKELVTR